MDRYFGKKNQAYFGEKNSVCFFDGWSKGGLLEHVLGRSWVHIMEDFEYFLVEFQELR